MKALLTASRAWSPLLQDLRAYLAYERDEGRDRIAISAASRPTRSNPTAPTPAARPQPPRSSRPEPTPPPAPARPAATSPSAPVNQPMRTSQPAAAGSPRDLDAIAQQVAACTRCSLSQTRTRTVPGSGHPHPDLMFIGEAPGEDEDRQGLPFVGRSGALLTRMIENLGLSRDEVFIANILKCRPPGNRTPTPQERETCIPFLEAQIDCLKPKVIVTLGGTALHGLLPDLEATISRCRGSWQEYRGIPLMPTYHPSYLLRAKEARFDTWKDMLQVLDRLGRPPPPPPPMAAARK